MEWSPNWDRPVYYHSDLDSSFYSKTDLSRFHALLSNTLSLSNSFRLPDVSKVGVWRKSIALPTQGFDKFVRSSSLVDKWLARLRDGSDEVPKVLLMALSPRLKDVSFICYDTWQGPTEFSSSHPLRLLSAVLRRLAPLPAQSWPCFQNLRKVTIAQQTELLHPHDAFYIHSRDIAPLFLLPRIEVLQLNLMMGEADNPDSDYEGFNNGAGKAYTFEWEPGRSTCKELNFYCCELAPETLASFIEATSSLRSIRGIRNQRLVIESLVACTTESLEILDGDGDSDMHEKIWEDHFFTRFRKLAHIKVVETWLMAGKTSPSSRSKEEDSTVEANSLESADGYPFHAAFPKSLKTLSIQHTVLGRSTHENPIPTLVGQLMDLVQAKRPDALENLTTICICNFGPPSVNDNEDHRLGEMTLQIKDLQKQCDANDIDLHTPGALPDPQICEACSIFQPPLPEPITSPVPELQ